MDEPGFEGEVGRTLEWGDANALVELTKLTAFRQGFGDLLAQGSYRLEWKGKANLVKLWQDFFCVIDAAGLCVFYSVRNLSNLELEILPTGILELINAAQDDQSPAEDIRVFSFHERCGFFL